MNKPIRVTRQLPMKRIHIMLNALRCFPRAEIYKHKFTIWKSHSRFIWNKYYE